MYINIYGKINAINNKIVFILIYTTVFEDKIDYVNSAFYTL